jgi:hypothetical protein
MMISVEKQQDITRRKELMKELKEINEGNKYFDILTKRKEHEETLKEIEGRVLGFFKGSKQFDQEQFNYYLFTLGDLTAVDRFFGAKELAIYDEKSGLKLDGFKYTVQNVYVGFARKLANRLKWEFANRKGKDEKLGEYQRNPRVGIQTLESKRFGASDRARVLELYPHLMYGNKLDINQIKDIWETSRPSAVKNMQKLTSVEGGKVMIESIQGKKKVYSFNPKYTFSGASGKKKEHDVKVYVDFLSEVIKKVKEIEKELAVELGVKELTHSALSLLHALIPYFHFQTFYAVTNPTDLITREGESIWDAKARELDNNQETILEFVCKKELARIISKGTTDLNYIDRDLYVLERVGAIVYTSNTILINPKLMFAMSDSLNNENDLYVKSVLMKFKDEKDAREQFARKGQDPKKDLLVRKKSSKKTKLEV